MLVMPFAAGVFLAFWTRDLASILHFYGRFTYEHSSANRGGFLQNYRHASGTGSSKAFSVHCRVGAYGIVSIRIALAKYISRFAAHRSRGYGSVHLTSGALFLGGFHNGFVVFGTLVVFSGLVSLSRGLR